MPKPQPPYPLHQDAVREYRAILAELPEPPRQNWQRIKIAELAKAQAKALACKADETELEQVARERARLGLAPLKAL